MMSKIRIDMHMETSSVFTIGITLMFREVICFYSYCHINISVASGPVHHYIRCGGPLSSGPYTHLQDNLIQPDIL